MLNELYTFAEPVQVVPFSNLKWGKFTLLHTMVAETIYMAWNSILCHPYSVDCHSFAHLNRWCKCGAIY